MAWWLGRVVKKLPFSCRWFCPKSLMWKLSQVGDLCSRWRYLPPSGRDIWPQGWDIEISAPKWFCTTWWREPLCTTDQVANLWPNLRREPIERTAIMYYNTLYSYWTCSGNVFLLNVRRANWLLLAALVSVDHAASERLCASPMDFNNLLSNPPRFYSEF